MGVCGIISEYNPFHNGHRFHIAETRRLLGRETAVVCVMSGNFVQRGEPAVLEKYQRAKCAVLGGADLVLELPLVSALSSAQGFARGGVSVLSALGGVTYLSFGTAAGDAARLNALHTAAKTPAFQAALREELSRGCSYPKAAQTAADRLCPADSSLLADPNSLLGLEYLSALEGTGIALLVICRRGPDHDSPAAAGAFAAASYLRGLLRENRLSAAAPYVPADTMAVLKDAVTHGACPASLENRGLLPLSFFRRLSRGEFARTAFLSEGLENRMWNAFYHASSFAQGIAAAKTRRYPESRIRRTAMCAFLSITRETAALPLSFLRVLAMNARGAALLRQAKTTCPLPIITRPLAGRQLTGAAKTLWELDLLADDLFRLFLPQPAPGGLSYTQTPFYLE